MSEAIIQGYRLSPQQKHLWLLQQRTRTSAFWSRCAVRITGPVDLERLERAIHEVVDQHEILRTTFPLLPGMTLPAQVIHEQSPECVRRWNVASLNVEEQNAFIAKLFAETPGVNGAHDSLPLFRCDLLPLSAAETVLLLKASALCADLRSLELIVSQITSGYEAQASTPEVMQYADFAEWHHELLEGEEGEPGRRYWSSHRLRPDVNLPFPERSPVETFEPEALRLQISSDGSDDLARVVLACWQMLIQRFNSPANVTIGKAMDGRRHPQLVNSAGPYNRYVPLIADLSDDRLPIDRFLDALEQAEEQAAQWQEYFGWDSADGSPKYFPVCFEERRGPTVFRVGDLAFSIFRREATDDRFNLKLVCAHNDTTPHLELHYDASRYAREDVRWLGKELTTLIAGVLGKPNTVISDLESLSSDERLRIVKGFNQTSREFSLNCIHKMFEAQAEKTLTVPAVVCGSAHVTYAELNRRANQLARRLQQLDVGPDVPVGLCLDRSIDFVVCMLAILKAGGAYVPVDVNTPAARLETMLSEAGAKVLISADERVFSGTVLPLNELRKELANEETSNCANNTTAANLAYVIFTSGSSGTPKGVAIEHRQLCNYVAAIDHKVGLSSCRNFAIVSTLVADLAHTMLFPSLLTGATLHLIPEDQAASPELLTSYFSRHAIDCLKIVPAHLTALLASAHSADILPRRHLLLGGEAPSPRLLEGIRELSPELTIWNHYGPTETTVGCVTQLIAPETQTITIGTPLANNTVYILDERQRPVPIGVAGELYVGGVQVARGYVNRAALTAQSFVPDPFGEARGGRLYRTGDKARYLTDGRIELLGRMDQQLKLRGYRIEPEEIQAVLNRHPEIAQSVVVAREDEARNEKRLVAYVVAKDSHSPAADDLRAFLGQYLPDYMVPLRFVCLEALPLTANGKIDRQALPAPEALEKQYVAPRNSVEQELSSIWSNVLGIAEPGITENFFELGGDSILGIQIIARANKAGMNLMTKQIFQHQTIAELAAVAQNGLRPRADQGIVTGEAPLTPVQLRFFNLGLPDPHHYNQAKLLKLREPMDSECLKQALESLLHHHDALRLRFFRVGQTWKQIISEPESELPFERIEIAHCEDTEVAATLSSEAGRLHAGLNLPAGPLSRVALFDGGDKTASYLLIVIHHLAVDAVSWGVLLEDLESAYGQVVAGEQVSLPPKTTSFKTWAEELTRFAQSATIAEEIDYWTTRLPQAATSLPIDRHGPNTVASRRTVSASLSADETRALLHELPTKHRTQINEVLLAALGRTFTSWTRASSLLIDLEGHGREHVIDGIDLTRTVGWFTTIFPVVLDVQNTSRPLDVLRHVKQQLRSVPNRGIGYGLLRYLSGRVDVVDQLTRAAQAEVRFNYLGQVDRFLASSRLFAAALPVSADAQSPKGDRGYLLNIISSVTDGELRFDWTYSENFHARNTIESLAERCVAELRAMLADSETSSAVFAVADFPKANLSQSDLEKILAKFRT